MPNHYEIAKIEDTLLGYEDHGILTAMLYVKYGAGNQGVGGYALDSWDDTVKRRVGSAFGLEFVIRILKACGVDKWENLKGRTIYVIKDGDNWMSKVVGIAPLPTEPGYEFIFEDLVKEFFPDAVE